MKSFRSVFETGHRALQRYANSRFFGIYTNVGLASMSAIVHGDFSALASAVDSIKDELPYVDVSTDAGNYTGDLPNLEDLPIPSIPASPLPLPSESVGPLPTVNVPISTDVPGVEIETRIEIDPTDDILVREPSATEEPLVTTTEPNPRTENLVNGDATVREPGVERHEEVVYINPEESTYSSGRDYNWAAIVAASGILMGGGVATKKMYDRARRRNSRKSHPWGDEKG